MFRCIFCAHLAVHNIMSNNNRKCLLFKFTANALDWFASLLIPEAFEICFHKTRNVNRKEKTQEEREAWCVRLTLERKCGKQMWHVGKPAFRLRGNPLWSCFPFGHMVIWTRSVWCERNIIMKEMHIWSVEIKEQTPHRWRWSRHTTPQTWKFSQCQKLQPEIYGLKFTIYVFFCSD